MGGQHGPAARSGKFPMEGEDEEKKGIIRERVDGDETVSHLLGGW